MIAGTLGIWGIVREGEPPKQVCKMEITCCIVGKQESAVAGEATCVHSCRGGSSSEASVS